MPSVAIVGGESLLGRELHDQLKETRIGASIELLGAGEAVLTEVEGEATVLTPLDAERVRSSDLIFCAGDADSVKRTHQLAGGQVPLIDLTGALEDLPAARLRGAVGGAAPEPDTVAVIAHPAASVLALLLSRIHRTFPMRHAVVQIFEPASERGRAGINELQQQVSSLLTFRPAEKRVFDAQAAFNLLPRYGEDAPEQLEDVEARIERHLTTLLQGQAPIPSLRLVQAPVFHGYSLSLWVEFESRPDATALAEAIASAQIEVRSDDLDAPTNVGVAGQSGVVVGLIEADANHPRGVWMWAVADNLRVSVDSAVELAREMLGSATR